MGTLGPKYILFGYMDPIRVWVSGLALRLIRVWGLRFRPCGSGFCRIEAESTFFLLCAYIYIYIYKPMYTYITHIYIYIYPKANGLEAKGRGVHRRPTRRPNTSLKGSSNKQTRHGLGFRALGLQGLGFRGLGV